MASIFLLMLITACAGTPPPPTATARPTLDPNYLTPPPEYRRTPTPRPTPLPISALGDPIAHIPGTGHNVVVEGDYAYASVGTDWFILDVNFPSQTTPVGHLTLPQPVLMTYIHDNIAYLGTDAGITIVDITVPTAPIRLGLLSEMGGPWRRMIVANDHAYVMWSMMGGIDIIDVSEPARPVKVGYYEGIRSQFSIEAVGNYVGIGGWSRVTILDVSDPVHPVQIGKPAHIPGDVTGIIVNGRYAYTGNYGVESSKGLIGTGLHVVDIADPRAVVEVGTYEPDYIGEGRKFGIVAVDETEVYLRGETYLWVLDVSNPSMPDFAKLYRKPEGTRDVAVAAGHIYVATEKEGLLVFRPRD